MSEVKLEQIQAVLKTFGLEDEDFQKLANEQLEDTTPFVQKMQAHIKETIKTDYSDVLEEFVKPFKDAPIGKENQLKKEARKFFGLQMTEDELKKTKFEDILKRGIETRQSSVNADTEKLQQTIAQLMEEKEALEASIPVKVQEVESQFVAKLREKETAEMLVNLAATEVPQVPKENIPMFVKALTGYANAEGHKITIDENKNVKVFDKDGLPIKDANGHIIKAKDYIKSFANGIVSNVAPRGAAPTASASLADGTKTKKYLDLMGKGFGN